jgi:hypothetical protein
MNMNCKFKFASAYKNLSKQHVTYLLIPKSDCYLVRGVIVDSKISSQLFLQTVSYMLAYLKKNKYYVAMAH